ncbi:cAMP-responsive element modulator-like isoform X1 [Xiphias gladius]|uniref:cAMP-responsive element modulator-like isoform X1 n=1 Tax=Xiphias gladius TaxID=8245 RepID=UPI001A98359D|nr:cAMP-responsive element modulator-like isoform X1 [Xiphias gladius]
MAVSWDETETGSAGDLTACQLHLPYSSLPQGLVGANAHSSKKPLEDALQRRELRLLKNREAARASRKRKKEYMDHLQTRNALLETENQLLKAQLQSLSNLNIRIPNLDQSPTPTLLSP